jgi:tetratricopeptide (TPR) repeat protein
MENEPPESSNAPPQEVALLLDQRVPRDLVFDDDPVEAILYNVEPRRPTPAGVIELISEDHNVSQECEKALVAILANHPHELVELQEILSADRFGQIVEILLRFSTGSAAENEAFLENLARCLEVLGRADDASEFKLRAQGVRLDSQEKELQKRFKASPQDAATLNQLARFLEEQRGDYQKAETYHRKALELTELRLGSMHPNVALALNELAILLRKMGRPAEAESLLRQAIEIEQHTLPTNSPKHPHRLNNLCTVLVMQGKLAEAKPLCARAWGLKSDQPDITSTRILFTRLTIALLEVQPVTTYVGQLKTLLAGAPLKAYGDVVTTWDVRSFIERMRHKLPASDTDFLEALVAALNDCTKLADLDRFPAWRDQTLIPLDARWPDS